MHRPVFLLMLVLGTLLLPAQAQIRYTITGLVAEGNQGLPGITVQLTGVLAQTTTTVADGSYTFDGLPAGDYTLTAVSDAYVFSPEQYSATLPGVGTLLPVFEAIRITARAQPPDPPALTLASAPNPFRTATTLRFQTAAAGPIRLTVSDLLGRSVATLAEGWYPAGTHAVVLDAASAALAPGRYVVLLTTDQGVRTQVVVVAP